MTAFISDKEFLGYSVAVVAESSDCMLDINIQPDTDLDSTFVAWCNDTNEEIIVNGWLFSFEASQPDASL